MFQELNPPATCPECGVELSADGGKVTAINALARRRARRFGPGFAHLFAKGLAYFLERSKCKTCKSAGRLPSQVKAVGHA